MNRNAFGLASFGSNWDSQPATLPFDPSPSLPATTRTFHPPPSWQLDHVPSAPPRSRSPSPNPYQPFLSVGGQFSFPPPAQDFRQSTLSSSASSLHHLHQMSDPHSSVPLMESSLELSVNKSFDSDPSEFDSALRRQGAQLGSSTLGETGFQGGARMMGSSSDGVLGNYEVESRYENMLGAGELQHFGMTDHGEAGHGQEEQYSDGDGEETDMEDMNHAEHGGLGLEGDLEASVGTAISLLLPIPGGYLSNQPPPTGQQSFDFRHVEEQPHNSPYSTNHVIQRATSYQYSHPDGTDDEDDQGHDRMRFYDRDEGQPDHETPPTSTSSDVESKTRDTDYCHNRQQRLPIIPPSRRNDSSPFIPALSHPRSAHLQRAYPNESIEEREYVSSSRRHTSSSTYPDQHPSDYDPDHSGPSSRPIKRLPSPKQLSWIPPTTIRYRPSGSGSSTPTSTSSTSTRKRPTAYSSSRKRVSKPTHESAPVALKRTEIPAVEEDENVKPYGCAFPSCLSRLESGRDPCGPVLIGAGSDKITFTGESWFRTIKDLREHCWIHKKAGEIPGETPFRCALDPCGKSFKSLAGLRWHFQNASANGHFYVSMDEGEEVPTKKFKACIESSGRLEKCPVSGCKKSFKQAAGLAYHLAHAPRHVVTEAMMESFSVTLNSKTRWWFRKKGLTIEGGEEDNFDDVQGEEYEENDEGYDEE